jgi:hypothetical protein
MILLGELCFVTLNGVGNVVSPGREPYDLFIKSISIQNSSKTAGKNS